MCVVKVDSDSDEEGGEDNFDSDDEDPETASDLVEGDIAVPDVSNIEEVKLRERWDNGLFITPFPKVL